jgi:putative transposase
MLRMLGHSWISSYFLVAETQKERPSMRYRHSTFGQLIAPLSRRAFQASVDRHDADAYDKSFTSWSHLLALIYGQLRGAVSLRALVAGWNAHSNHHYHFGVGELARSTLSDANARRCTEVFAEAFSQVSSLVTRGLRRQGAQMLRLIDATPIPLDQLFSWAKSNGRTRGLKLHVVYDPELDHPRRIDITHATVNDIEIGKAVQVEAGATYVFDKAYCSYAWWTSINAAGACFVTRSKKNVRYRVTYRRELHQPVGEGYVVLSDDEVSLASKGDSKLPIPLRRLRVRRDKGGMLTLITNDLKRSATDIAALYKARWQIELLFRWIKQHLKIRTFLGRSENAVRLQLIAALIAFVLLRIAAHLTGLAIAPIRFAELVATSLFLRNEITQISRPPYPTPASPPPNTNQLHLELSHA